METERKKIPVKNEFASMIHATGQSQREIAEKIGVHYNTINNWCSGRSKPPKLVILWLKKRIKQK